MKFLLDTNIFIKLEPGCQDDLESLSKEARELVKRIRENRDEIFLHPKSRDDIKRDTNEERRSLRLKDFEKFPILDNTDIPAEFKNRIKTIGCNPNDHVDNHLLAAVYRNAVHFLVTEDQGLHKKARDIGIEEKVCSITDALDMLRRLDIPVSVNRPAIEKVKCYTVDVSGPLFNTLKLDYKEFGDWFKKKCLEGRDCFVIHIDKVLAGICIFTEKSKGPNESTKRLKICTFKIAESARGEYLGELLLRATLDHAYALNCQDVYLTAFPENERVCLFFKNFGFEKLEGENKRGECVFQKRLLPPTEPVENDPWAYHLHYGPKFRHPDSQAFAIPIQPHYHSLLFPELDQSTLFEGRSPYGNGILKAYLCKSNLKDIPRGSQLFFYRSQDRKSMQAIGVVEKIFRSCNPECVAAFVGKRTVYERDAINKICDKEILCILFRQANSLSEDISLKRLIKEEVIQSAPQSITKITDGGLKWIMQQQIK